MWKTLRINMNTLTTSEEPFKDEYLGLGGRGLVAQVMMDEVDPSCDPLGSENKVILSTTAFAGMGLGCVNRLSVGCKSPLTGGIKEANVGGTVATYMVNNAIRLIILEGQPKEDGLWVVHIDATGQARLEEARDCQGMNNYKLIETLLEKYGNNIAVASIGIAGERCYKNSTVQVTDFGTNFPSRAAARGGTGAVLGSKKVKAIVLEKAEHRFSPEYMDKESFVALRSELNRLMTDNSADHPLRKVGTPDGVRGKHHAGALPVRNFSGQKLDNIDQITSDKFMKIISKRGKNAQSCQAGCLVHCSNQIFDTEGKHITGGIEYETIALCGANVAITDLDVIAQIDHMCDDLGIDTIETGATIGVCMDGGKIAWGDSKAAIGLIQEMMDGTEFGILMGGGTEVVGKYLGVRRIPVAKHQAMGGYDPRGSVITGVSYASSAMGADHTVAPSEGICADMSPEEICKMSKTLQTMFAMCDSLFCLFSFIFLNKNLDKLAALYAAVYGGSATPDRLLALGTRTLELEKTFNKGAGWTEEDDVLPDFFYTEKSEITGVPFNVPQKNLSMTLATE